MGIRPTRSLTNTLPHRRRHGVAETHFIATDSVVVRFVDAFPDVCPRNLAPLRAGEIREGVFYPSGSVSQHFFQRQRDFDRSRAKPKAHVYFVGAAGCDVVKIGMAINVERRLEVLQSMSPVELFVCAIAEYGGASLERVLHRRFDEYRLHGEWFAFADDIRACIDQNGWWL